MFLTESQAEERLRSEKNLARRFGPEKEIEPTRATITEVTPLSRGRNKVALSEEVRTEIAIRARAGETQTELAEEFSLVPSTIHCIEKGKTKGIDEKKVDADLDIVKDKALDRLMVSLGLLTDDKLSGCSAKDLSVIASNMGRVVEKIQPKAEQPDNINFIIYTPELKQERAFQVVEI